MDFDTIENDPVDYMHCVLLGVVRTFVSLWFDSKHHREPWSVFLWAFVQYGSHGAYKYICVEYEYSCSRVEGQALDDLLLNIHKYSGTRTRMLERWLSKYLWAHYWTGCKAIQAVASPPSYADQQTV